jgi:transcriptional regulator with XRE-family HTH domain
MSKRLGMNVKRIREEKELTQEALAERVKVHRVYLAQIEAGTKIPSIPTLEKIAKALKVKLTALLE